MASVIYSTREIQMTIYAAMLPDGDQVTVEPPGPLCFRISHGPCVIWHLSSLAPRATRVKSKSRDYNVYCLLFFRSNIKENTSSIFSSSLLTDKGKNIPSQSPLVRSKGLQERQPGAPPVWGCIVDLIQPNDRELCPRKG